MKKSKHLCIDYWTLQFEKDNFTLFSVDCQWSDWKPSGSCSKSCGGGAQKFTRDKTVSESNGGSWSGSNEKTDTCNTQDCTSGPGKLEYIWKKFITSKKICV